MLKRCLSTAVNFYEPKNLQQELLKSHLRKTSNQFICLKNPLLAEKVCQSIGNELIDGNKMVFEASPGPGILTEQLLKFGVSKLRVFEHIEKRITSLQALKSTYGDRFEIVDKQILDFATGNYKVLNIDREEFQRTCFDNVPVMKNWAKVNNNPAIKPEESSLKLIAAISPHLCREFLSFLVYSLSHYDVFFSLGPTEFYLFMSVSNYKQILSKPSRNLKYYTAFTIHINSLFDYSDVDLYSSDIKGIEKVKIENEIRTTISSDHFQFTNDRTFKTNDSFVLVKIRPKPFVNQLNSEFLMNYVIFVKQSFIKPSNSAIKFYEKHFPGCGIDLIALGISYFKTLGDLTSDEMFNIFNRLYQTKQYQNSIFKELAG